MALSADDLVWVRSWVSDATPPTDADLNSAYDRLGSRAAVVREVLRERLAVYLANPAQFTAEDYSQNVSANIKALQDMLGSPDLADDPDPDDDIPGGSLRIIPPYLPPRR